jgi:hypothetical protein
MVNINKYASRRCDRRQAGRDQYRVAGLFSLFIESHPEFTVIDFLKFVREKVKRDRCISSNTVGKHYKFLVRGFQSVGLIVRSNRFIMHPSRAQRIAVWVSRPRGA